MNNPADIPTYKIAVVGSRTLSNAFYCDLIVDMIRDHPKYITDNSIIKNIKLLSGGAKGIDTLAEIASTRLGIEIEIFVADWENFGKQAGIVRNKEMAYIADEVIAIWDGKSKGTKHMIEYSIRLGLPVTIIKVSKVK